MNDKKLKIVEEPIPTFYGDEISHVNALGYGLNCLKSVFSYKLHKMGLIKIKKFDLRSYDKINCSPLNSNQLNTD